MPGDEGEDLQSPARGLAFPPGAPLSPGSVTYSLEGGDVEVIDISKGTKGGKPNVPEVMVHGRERVWLAGVALVISLILPCIPVVPDNVRTGLLAIAGSISTSLFKGFEKY